VDDRNAYLSALLGHPLEDRAGQRLGRLADIIVRLRGASYPLVTGLVARVGSRHAAAPSREGRRLPVRNA